jgi:hypothetical protein
MCTGRPSMVPALPNDPEVKAENSWRVNQGCHDLPLDGNAVFVNLPIKRFAQRYQISIGFGAITHVLRRWIEPELRPIKRVESTSVDHVGPGRLIFGAKENSG